MARVKRECKLIAGTKRSKEKRLLRSPSRVYRVAVQAVTKAGQYITEMKN